MAIFGKIKNEPIAQEDDLNRIDCTESIVSKGEAAITLIRIDPGDGSGYVDVTPSPATKTSEYFLDWGYSTAGSYTINLEITTDGAPVVFSESITIISEADDKLFSTDQDLELHEPDVKKWIVDGRNTFKDIHRRSQVLILDYFRVNGFRAQDGDKITKDEILDLSEVKEWSTFLTLALIFEGRSNAIGDLFAMKADKYKAKMIMSRESVFTSYDWNKDGSINTGEKNLPFSTVHVCKL